MRINYESSNIFLGKNIPMNKDIIVLYYEDFFKNFPSISKWWISSKFLAFIILNGKLKGI